MTRDEWVVLPIAGQVERRRFRREDIGDYWPRQFPEGEAVMLMRRHTDLLFTITLPLAEFEALLFAPAPSASDDYTRAAVDAMDELLQCGLDHDSFILVHRNQWQRARDALRLYREKHGG